MAAHGEALFRAGAVEADAGVPNTLTVASESAAGVRYTVHGESDKPMRCSCPAWVLYHTQCKHIAAAMAFLSQDPADGKSVGEAKDPVLQPRGRPGRIVPRARPAGHYAVYTPALPATKKPGRKKQARGTARSDAAADKRARLAGAPEPPAAAAAAGPGPAKPRDAGPQIERDWFSADEAELSDDD